MIPASVAADGADVSGEDDGRRAGQLRARATGGTLKPGGMGAVCSPAYDGPCGWRMDYRENSREVTQDYALSAIEKALADVEDAICHHPQRVRSLYARGKAAFLERQDGVEQAEWSRAHDLTTTESSTMHEYLVAASFMSAWFHVHWDKRRRDVAAQSACVLVSGLGPDPLEVMRGFIVYEQAWRTCMRSAGIGLGRKVGCLVAVLSVIAIVLCLVLR